MKSKDLKSIRVKTLEELKEALKVKRQDIDKLFVKILSGQEKNVKTVRNLKVDVAQIMTIISEKEVMAKEAKI